jgi:nucleotide-binding universal stress UspA family protein
MRVLIATDGSEIAINAARQGLEVLGSPAEVALLYVLTSVPGDEAAGFGGPVSTPEEMELEWSQERADANAALERTAAALPPTSAEVERRTEVGDAGAAIITVSEEIGADVIVVGSHGRGFFGRIVHLGSVSEHVVRNASCPVLVVRAARQVTE